MATTTTTQAGLDIDWIRAQFPALKKEVDGQPAAFLDGPGGTQVPRRVIEAMVAYLTHANANTHGHFLTSQRTDQVIVAAHAAMADLLGCDADEIIFGPNMTSLTFMISRAIGRELVAGDEIVVTALDHDANVAPWRALADQGVVIRTADLHPVDCTLDLTDLARLITPRTRLVAVGYASNAVGSITDVAAVARLAHAAGAMVFVDAVHYAPHGPIDVRALDCDFLACSPYKFFAPHSGVLYGQRRHLTRLRPYKVRPATEELPYRWETGTQSHEAMAGVAAAIDYLAELGRGCQLAAVNRRAALLAAMTAIKEYERALSVQLVAGLLALPGLTLYGIRQSERFAERTPTVAVTVAGIPPRALAQGLAQRGLFTWNGNYYALGLTERLGLEASGGMLRIGLVHYNTRQEIDRLVAALGEMIDQALGAPPPSSLGAHS